MPMRFAIYGVGDYGKKALIYFGRENIAYFIDNDVHQQGKRMAGIEILSFENFIKIGGEERIIVAVKDCKMILEQLQKQGIENYELYCPNYAIQEIYPTDTLIFNSYETASEVKSEEEWTIKTIQSDRTYYELYIEDLYRRNPIFGAVEIETYNRCNGNCSFCPVNRMNDPRVETKMSEELFKKIIGELEEMNYKGRLSLFSNNEPFLDDRIIEFHRYARERVPGARMHLYTNGTLLTLEMFKEIIPFLDELIIDNYNQQLNLIPNSRNIKNYCEEHTELIKKVTIVLRKPNEILTSRGGNAPNRKEIKAFSENRCIYPFTQMIIRPDGKCSLCCNDPLGMTTLGDVSKATLYDIWQGEEYVKLRKAIYKGRGNVPHCVKCDNFDY